MAEIEADRAADPKDTRAAVRAAVEARYTLPVEGPSGTTE